MVGHSSYNMTTQLARERKKENIGKIKEWKEKRNRKIKIDKRDWGKTKLH